MSWLIVLVGLNWAYSFAFIIASGAASHSAIVGAIRGYAGTRPRESPGIDRILPECDCVERGLEP